MITIPAFAAIKNGLSQDDYLMMVELRYDDGDELTPEIDRSYVRYYRPFNQPPPTANPDVKSIMFEGKEWMPLAMGNVKQDSKTTGEIPAFDIAISNIDGIVKSVIQLNIIENKTGRLIYVQPTLLSDDTAKLEERFTIVSASTNNRVATITVSSLGVDLWGLVLPWELVDLKNFPGILGNRAFSMH